MMIPIKHLHKPLDNSATGSAIESQLTPQRTPLILLPGIFDKKSPEKSLAHIYG
jgi:hypothetical protein